MPKRQAPEKIRAAFQDARRASGQTHIFLHEFENDLKALAAADKSGRIGFESKQYPGATIIAVWQQADKDGAEKTSRIDIEIPHGAHYATLRTYDTQGWNSATFSVFTDALRRQYGSLVKTETSDDRGSDHTQLIVTPLPNPQAVIGQWAFHVFGPNASFMRRPPRPPHVGE